MYNFNNNRILESSEIKVELDLPLNASEINKNHDIITNTDDLSDDELNDLSREIAKKELPEEATPIEPTQKDLEKLSKVLNIKYDEEVSEVDRLTDTTQTLIVKTKKEDDKDEGTTLTYRGR